MVALFVLTLLVSFVSVSLMVAMLVRDDAFLGVVGLMLVMVAGFMAMTYGMVNAA